MSYNTINISDVETHVVQPRYTNFEKNKKSAKCCAIIWFLISSLLLSVLAYSVFGTYYVPTHVVGYYTIPESDNWGSIAFRGAIIKQTSISGHNVSCFNNENPNYQVSDKMRTQQEALNKIKKNYSFCKWFSIYFPSTNLLLNSIPFLNNIMFIISKNINLNIFF
jgi:hypothetical protein